MAEDGDEPVVGKSEISRRAFLKGAAVGAVAAGVAAVTPSLLSGVVDSVGEGSDAGAGTDPIVAYVRDPAKGEVVIMSGTSKVVRRDPGLAARIVSARPG